MPSAFLAVPATETSLKVSCVRSADSTRERTGAFKVFGRGELVTYIRSNSSSIPLGSVGKVTALHKGGLYTVKFVLLNHTKHILTAVRPSDLQRALHRSDGDIGGY